MMLLILTAVMLVISCFVDWIKGLDELIAFGEYVDDLEDMLDDNTACYMLDNNFDWEAVE